MSIFFKNRFDLITSKPYSCGRGYSSVANHSWLTRWADIVAHVMLTLQSSLTCGITHTSKYAILQPPEPQDGSDHESNLLASTQVFANR